MAGAGAYWTFCCCWGCERHAVHIRERSLTRNNKEVNIITKLGSGCLSATYVEASTNL